MLPSWKTLERDIAREEAEGKVKAGTRPLWKLIKACIQDKKCEPAVKEG
jgi:protein O-GlcNAc transferase